MFAVATFTATGEVDAVPVSWLRDCEGVCCWPPYKTYARLTKAKTSGETPTAEWSSHSVRCLYKTGEFFYVCELLLERIHVYFFYLILEVIITFTVTVITEDH